MTDLSLFIEAFHLIRPLWLILLPVVGVIWWSIRRRANVEPFANDGLAPHLRDAMLLGAKSARRLQPIDGVAAILVVTILGASGPTWSRVPDPFLAQTAPVVIVLEVSTSMEATDIMPSRLERAKQKIRDLLELRAGARTALVAYSGTAHRVVPLTEDAQVMLPYLEGLSPEIMPEDGSNATAALEIATDILAAQEAPGGVLFVLDGFETSDLPSLSQVEGTSVAFLAMLPEGTRDQGLDQISDAPVVYATPEGNDVRQIDRSLNTAFRRAMLEDESQQWNDRAWWFAWPAAFLTLLWFRRGWTMQWGLALAVFICVGAPMPLRADGLKDYFLTPDQQGRLAYDRKDFDRASELFIDPLWQGYALFKNGSYEKAAEVLGRVDTAEAEFIRALAFIRNRNYRDGVRSFEAVVERDPSFPGAAENLEVAREIVEYVEKTREQSDTGEDSGIGADEVVFDNESDRGVGTELVAPTEESIGVLTTEQWMNTVDTRTSDFLRLRFLLETSKEQ
ncbi:VWA domain-containing protein [Sulfitobacter sp. SK012]|uniref:VWA domain-containing protein n=1 Tax=Sulfitobacter sp. SK012 TaxID=1389005 RepID=UPI000E0C7FA8|nr:VWA domain-containing protein [Sulfitobacter sp. SK012]AXI44733.1 VWA domain-containing protein [Sulfitobacter sp. SK012]